MMTTETITINEAQQGLRLDAALAALLPQYSRSQIQQWIKSGAVSNSDKNNWRARDKVEAGQIFIVKVELQNETSWQACAVELDIVYEDDDLIVINKPAGLVVHPGAGVPTGTLVNGLLQHAPGCANLPRCGIVHRIDKETTGLLVAAKSPLAHQSLTEQLADRSMSRHYEAVIKGTLIAGGSIDAPIDRHPKQRIKMAVHPTGRHAVTHYRVMERFEHYTHVSVTLETGRTHQIRVHFDHQHHPLVGDPVYGKNIKPPAAKTEQLREAIKHFKRQALHARKLTLVHPRSNEPMSWECELPQDMTILLEALRDEQLYRDQQ